jgi:hypothetical protein
MALAQVKADTDLNVCFSIDETEAEDTEAEADDAWVVVDTKVDGPSPASSCNIC